MEISTADTSPYRDSHRLPSFLIAGFEGADHRNGSGHPVAMLDATGHAAQCGRNDARLRALGIRVVRESVGWSRSERGGRYDFSCALRRAEAARKAGLHVIWTLWHYGLPDDIALFDDALAERFSAFAYAAATALADPSIPDPIFCPVNEISFLAWAACESALIYPYRGSPGAASSACGFVLKQRLVRAALAGCDAIRAAIPGARMLHIDPLVHVVAPATDPLRADEAAHVRTFQFQAWDMLTGRLAPELGGAPRHLDLVGVNYYHGNQFEVGTERRLHWHLRDSRRMPFRALLHEVAARYGRPVLIAETSHFGIGRDRWLGEIARETQQAMREGVRVAGVCLYPIIDRPDWEQPGHWHHSGLWDRCVARDGRSFERLCLPYLRALRSVQSMFDDTSGANAEQGRRSHTARRDDAHRYALVVFAPGAWADIGWPRRALIESLALHWTVFVVEGAESQGSTAPPHRSGLVVLAPRAPASVDDAHDDGAAATVACVLDALAAYAIDDYAVWLLTPHALPVVEHLAPDVVAYAPAGPDDACAHRDPRDAKRHQALLAIAGVVGEVSRRRLEQARHVAWPPGACATLHHAAERRAARLPGFSRRRPVSDVECAIIGAGVAGLCAALHYGAGSVLLERDVAPGGSRRSAADQGFLFDFTGHVLDGRDDLGDLYRRLLGDNVAWRDKSVAVVSHRPHACRASSLAAYFAAFDAGVEPIGYPLRGGTQALVDGFLPLLSGELVRAANVARILPQERAVVLDDLRRVRYEQLIGTLPLPTLVALCEDDAPPDIRAAAQRLRTQSLRCVNIGVRGTPPSRHDWLLHDDGAIFDRAFMQGNVSPAANREGGFAIVCEIVHSSSRPLSLHGASLIGRCVDDCLQRGLIATRDSVIVTHEIDIPVACVVDGDPRAANLGAIERWLGDHGIAFTGSRGAWETGRCRAPLASGRRAAWAARRAIGEARTRTALR